MIKSAYQWCKGSNSPIRSSVKDVRKASKVQKMASAGLENASSVPIAKPVQGTTDTQAASGSGTSGDDGNFNEFYTEVCMSCSLDSAW